MVLIRVSGLLFDRVADSLGVEHPTLDIGRRGRWESRKVGFGHQLSVDVPADAARRILGYFDAIGRLDGSGMDPDGAAETRAEARAARTAAKAIRRQL